MVTRATIPQVPEVQANRGFNALNGKELQKAILAQIERQMSADQRFSQHLSYARCAWRFRCAIDFYPNDANEKWTVETTADIRPPVPRRDIGEDETPVEVNLSGERTVAAPVAGDTADQVRRESGLPVPKPRSAPGPEGTRINVDAPEVPTPGKGADSEVIEETRVQMDVPKGGHTLARSATVRTRANPKGVAAPPTAGSAPTEQDMEKIIERGLADGTLEKADK